MSCPSAIFTVNTNVTVAEGGVVPMGSVIRRYGRSCQLNGTGIDIVGQGYYDIESSLTFTPEATGAVTYQFLKDGVAIPGALATAQGTTAQPMNLSVTGLARNCGCDCNSSITAIISAAGVVNNVATIVEKA